MAIQGRIAGRTFPKRFSLHHYSQDGIYPRNVHLICKEIEGTFQDQTRDCLIRNGGGSGVSFGECFWTRWSVSSIWKFFILFYGQTWSDHVIMLFSIFDLFFNYFWTLKCSTVHFMKNAIIISISPTHEIIISLHSLHLLIELTIYNCVKVVQI